MIKKHFSSEKLLLCFYPKTILPNQPNFEGKNVGKRLCWRFHQSHWNNITFAKHQSNFLSHFDFRYMARFTMYFYNVNPCFPNSQYEIDPSSSLGRRKREFKHEGNGLMVSWKMRISLWWVNGFIKYQNQSWHNHSIYKFMMYIIRWDEFVTCWGRAFSLRSHSTCMAFAQTRIAKARLTITSINQLPLDLIGYYSGLHTVNTVII